MINTNYANAYKEVLIVLNNLIKEDYEKIPKEYIESYNLRPCFRCVKEGNE